MCAVLDGAVAQYMAKIVSRLPREHLAAYLFYLLITLVITWPLVTQFSTRILGGGNGDATEVARNIWWMKFALQNGLPILHQPYLGYPEGISGAWLWANPLRVFPAWLFAFFMPLPAAYNLAVLLQWALIGWSMYYLVWKVTGQRSAAIIAGVILTAFSLLQVKVMRGHVEVLQLWAAPLYIYALLRLRQSPDKRWIGLAALFFFLAPLGHMFQVMYVLAPITAVFGMMFILQRAWSALGRLALALVMAMLALSVFFLPLINDASSYVAEQGDISSVTFSADLFTIFTPSPLHPFFDGFAFTERVLGDEAVWATQSAGYVGLVAAVLMFIAVWKVPESRWVLWLAVLTWLLSLGPLLKAFGELVPLRVGSLESYIPLPWALAQNLPVINVTRAPGRFNYAFAVAVALLAGYGMKAVGDWLLAFGKAKDLTQRREEAKTQTNLSTFNFQLLTFNLLLTAFILWEYQFYWSMPTVNGVPPQAISDLAGRDDIRAVFDVPWEKATADKDALFLQTAHQHPMIAGHIARETPIDAAKPSILQATFDPALLDAAGVDVVIFHQRRDHDREDTFEKLRESLGEPTFDNGRLALFDVPDPQTAPQFTTAMTSNIPVTDESESHLFAPESGWARLTGKLTAERGRVVHLLLDGEPLYQWELNQETPLDLPIPIPAVGYHTLKLALDPPCPISFDTALECRALLVADLTLSDYLADPPENPVQFDRGAALRGIYAPSEISLGDDLPLYLWWKFDQPLTENDVRFVHVLDAEGNLIAQADSSPGEKPVGGWTESLSIALPEDTPAGDYQVCVGWYSYPDLARRAVLTEIEGAANGLACVSQFTLKDGA
jgi:hypothetical protein